MQRFNDHARRGVEPDFNRGIRTHDLYQGDEEIKPKPCLGPLERAPCYAVRIYAAEINTCAGIRTEAAARA